MLLKRLTRNVAALALATLAAGAAPAVAAARDKSPDDSLSTVTVTVTSKDDGAAPRLAPSDFAVYRGKSRQEIVDVKGPGEAPVNVAVLIQEGLDQGVGNEIERIKKFVLALPEGSQVMVGYLRGTGLSIRQPFTTSLEEAAGELRIPVSTPSIGSAPFIGLIEALDEFDGLAGRNQVVLVSNGLDVTRGVDDLAPGRNIDLDRAISRAQKRGIPVWSLYANWPGSIGRSSALVTFGQGALNRLSDETGGKAFFAGSGFVTFDHALDTIQSAIDNQYLIAYRGGGQGDLDVTVETRGVKVRHAK
jgi:hypothetical protein